MLENNSIFQSFHDYFLTKRLMTRDQLRLTAHPEPLLLSPVPAVETSTVIETDKKSETVTIAKPTQGLMPQVMYINQSIALLKGPYQSYDNCLRVLSYGDAVTVVSYHNDYAEVQRGTTIGWVKKDCLQERKEAVWPVWVMGQWYPHDDEMTKRTRLLLVDMFFAEAARLPLQPAEFVSGQLLADNRIINWPVHSGRVPGQWHQLLRGVQGIHMSIQPLADGLMEWTDEQGVGHIGYVKEVQLDNSLRLEGVGILEEGILESVFLPASLWREWRPVFIEVG